MTADAVSRPVAGLRLHLRSSVALTAVSALGVAAFFWPLLDPSLLADHSGDAPWLFVSLLPLALAVLYAELSDGVLDAKAVAGLGILAGVDAALRPLSGGGSGFTLVYLLIICGGGGRWPAAGAGSRSFSFSSSGGVRSSCLVSASVSAHWRCSPLRCSRRAS